MSDVEEVKRRLNIVDVIQDYVKLQKSGSNFRGRCPFHTEKTPSFFVSPEKQIWHCFGSCAKGGDIFSFLMELEGIEFRQALEILAKRAGVKLEHFERELHRDEKLTLFDINQAATDFFQKALEKTKGGERANDYYKKRGIHEELKDIFKIGYAPSSWRALSSFLIKNGFQKSEIVSSGLAIENEGGQLYDRFRARLMFPIFSPNGQIVGFSGRVLLENEKEAKYINTPQTIIYDKSKELYGFYQAKTALKEKGEAIIVEGNIDVILSHQAGVTNTVATCGTALTGLHLSLLSRSIKKIILSFDNDQAGQKASFRAFQLAQQHNFTLYTLAFEGGKDPADIVSQKGSHAWQEIIKNKVHFMEYLWNALSKKYSIDSIEGKKELSDEFFSFLLFIVNRIEQSHWISELAKRLRVRDEDMFESFRKFEIDKNNVNRYDVSTKPSQVSKAGEGIVKVKRDRIFQDKENFIALFMAYPDLCKKIIEISGAIALESIAHIKKEVDGYMTKDELLLKAQSFWPSEYLAKKELLRIFNDLSIGEKKRGLKTLSLGNT